LGSEPLTRKEIMARWRNRNRDRIREINSQRDMTVMYDKRKEQIRKDPRAYLLRAAKRRAKKSGREFTITLDDIVIPDVCPVLGTKLIVLSEGYASPDSMSIDRIDNDKGYVPGNICVISYRANVLKKDATLSELKSLVKYLEKTF